VQSEDRACPDNKRFSIRLLNKKRLEICDPVRPRKNSFIKSPKGYFIGDYNANEESEIKLKIFSAFNGEVLEELIKTIELSKTEKIPCAILLKRDNIEALKKI
jgi:hypothetical protein